MARERWGSKLGIILAVAGSAIGLGNFLRFPGVAAQNGGGGAFMIPYFVALLLLGLPLMWIEWTIGRFGGGFGHSTAPGMFHTMCNKNRFIKYFGVIGIFGPVVIFVYYTYIESWLLGYSWFALTGAYSDCKTAADMGDFLGGYLGGPNTHGFNGVGMAYGFFIATFAANILVVMFGIKRGIEAVCKYALPLLLVLAVVLMVRVFTLGTPNPDQPQNSVMNGLGFLWNPDWSRLSDPGIWLAAAGQIFFTLSVGIGVILTYASYLTRKDDVALSGLTAASANEFAEVVLGGSIVIPAAVAFFGVAVASGAAGSVFGLGFKTMPLVLEKMAFGNIFGFMWFFLLFLAGITSSISLAQPAIAFLEDEFKLTKREGTLIFAVVTFLLCQTCIFGKGDAVIDEFDFWGCNIGLVVFGTVEVILFGWVFGIDKSWTELHTGSDITIPRVYRFIIKYVTPLVLLVILEEWLRQKWLDTILFRDLPAGDPSIQTRIFARLLLVIMFGLLCVLVYVAWRRRDRNAASLPLEDAP